MSEAVRDNKGRFAAGSKHQRKKDWTLERAKDVTSKELYWCAHTVSEVPYKELREAVQNGSLDNESLLTYSVIKRAVKGDFKPLQFILEMINGKARQQTEIVGGDGGPVSVKYVQDD